MRNGVCIDMTASSEDGIGPIFDGLLIVFIVVAAAVFVAVCCYVQKKYFKLGETSRE